MKNALNGLSTRTFACFSTAIVFVTASFSAFAWHKDYLIAYQTIPGNGSCCFAVAPGLAGATWSWTLHQGQTATLANDTTTVAWNLLQCGSSYAQPMSITFTVAAGTNNTQYGHTGGSGIDCGICS